VKKSIFAFRMNAIITVFKNEFEEKSHVLHTLRSIAGDVKEVNEAYVIIPKSGSLMQVLTFLKEKNIAYGTHFNSNPDI
jgi:hypothetical protein